MRVCVTAVSVMGSWGSTISRTFMSVGLTHGVRQNCSPTGRCSAHARNPDTDKGETAQVYALAARAREFRFRGSPSNL
jgi:hypothetical protein